MTIQEKRSTDFNVNRGNKKKLTVHTMLDAYSVCMSRWLILNYLISKHYPIRCDNVCMRVCVCISDPNEFSNHHPRMDRLDFYSMRSTLDVFTKHSIDRSKNIRMSIFRMGSVPKQSKATKKWKNGNRKGGFVLFCLLFLYIINNFLS